MNNEQTSKYIFMYNDLVFVLQNWVLGILLLLFKGVYFDVPKMIKVICFYFKIWNKFIVD